MAKIGTAQIEIKPVLNAEALQGITDQIEKAVQLGVRRGLQEMGQRHVDRGGLIER